MNLNPQKEYENTSFNLRQTIDLLYIFIYYEIIDNK